MDKQNVIDQIVELLKSASAAEAQITLEFLQHLTGQ